MTNQNCIDMQDISKKMQNFCNSFQLLCLCIQNNCSIAHGQNQNKVSKQKLYFFQNEQISFRRWNFEQDIRLTYRFHSDGQNWSKTVFEMV